MLISHNHYDHLDLRTLRQIAARGRPTFIVAASGASENDRSHDSNCTRHRSAARQVCHRDDADFDVGRNALLAGGRRLSRSDAQVVRAPCDPLSGVYDCRDHRLGVRMRESMVPLNR